MGKGGAGKGGRQAINGPRQTGTVIEWKGKFGWIKPLTPISHPKSKQGKVFLSAEDVVEELDGVGAKVSFALYSDSNGLGAGDVRMASAAPKAAARNSNVTTVGNVAPTFSKGKGNVAATAAKGKGKVGKGASFDKGSKVVSSTATQAGKFASKAVAGKVAATWSKGGSSKGGSLQKSSAVQQTAWQKPRQEQSQKGGVTKGKGKGDKGAAGNAAKGSGKDGKQAKRDMIYDKPLIGTITQWKGKFGWIKPNDTIDHPLAKKHQGDLFLGQQDVETEISGEGARVRFMLYEDSHGLGAANVRAA